MTTIVYCIILLSLAPSTPPQNFTVKVLSSTDVFLRWFPPLLDQQNGEIRSYHVRQYETSTGILTNHTQEGNHTELVVGSLHAHYQYQFTIAAETVQLGPFSNPVTVTTLESGQFMLSQNLPLIYIMGLCSKCDITAIIIAAIRNVIISGSAGNEKNVNVVYL